MIGLDTNVLLRYFAQDDVVQSYRASEIMEASLTISDPGFVSVATVVETVWVLERAYGMSTLEIVGVLESLLQADTLVIQNEAEVFTAASLLRSGDGSFPDALIGELGLWAGCSKTLTFDKKAARLKSFEPA